MDSEEINLSSPNGEPHNISNPQMPLDYVDETGILKGDAIGSTLYSERFVLKTLMKLASISETDWCEDFERDLCNLWDMTIEPDVVAFLMKHDFIKLSESLLQGPLQDPRFIEIIVGLLRNMCCCDYVRQYISENTEMTQLLIHLLSTPDSLMLIQLVGLLESVAWDLVKQNDERSYTTQKHWLEKLMDSELLCEKFSFLLKSSTNEDLLYGVLQLLYTLCTYSATLSDKDFSQYFANSEMVSSLIECWKQLFETNDCSMNEEFDNSIGDFDDASELFLSKKMFKAAKKWVSILASFAGHQKGREAMVDNGDALSIIMARLIYLKNEDERREELLTGIVNILEALIPTHFIPGVLNKLLKILHDLTEDKDFPESEKIELIEICGNFFETCLKIGSKAKITEALELCENENHLTVLFWSIIEKRDPELMVEWTNNDHEWSRYERSV